MTITTLKMKGKKRVPSIVLVPSAGVLSNVFLMALHFSQDKRHEINDQRKEKLQKVVKKTWTLFYDMCHLRKNSCRDS